jgi:hypothetical protein
MIASELNALYDLATKLLSKFRKQSVAPEDSLATRYVKLFKKHGIHRNQIPRFTGNGLTAVDVQNDQSLIMQLTEERLAACCDLFQVNREWLDGNDDTLFPDHFFYKHPEHFEAFVKEMSSFRCLFLIPENHSDDRGVLVIEEEVGYVGDRQIVRYHTSQGWPYNYWKARVYVASCCAIASRYHTSPFVVWVPKEKIDQLLYSADELELSFLGHRIHGDDLAESPEALTQGLPREDKVFAIDLWKRLHERGFMQTNISFDRIAEEFQSYRDTL